MYRKYLFLLIFLPFVLSGCETMSRDECAAADWQQVGYKDGGEGRPRARIEEHARACAQEDFGVDRARYFAGYDQGLGYYCTPSNGLRAGRAGHAYYDVCPPHLAPGFLEPYRYGREIYQTRSRIDGLDRNRREREQRLQKAQTDDERRRLRNELYDIDQHLRRERDRLEVQERGVIWR
jgi:hypothetical protein